MVVSIAILILIPLNKANSRSIQDIKIIVIEAAIRHKIEAKRFLAVAKCESSLRPRVIGDGGKSYGLWQIHSTSHPTVTKEQALDPVWATEWAAVKWKKDPTIWTCYKLLYMTETTNIPTPKLLDEEARLAQEKRALMSRVTLEIEKILLREDLTVGDLLEIFGLFTGRANSLFERIKIKTIKENYERTQ